MSGNRGNRLRFSKDEDDELIGAVSKNPSLYDLKHKQYHDHSARDAIWDTIAKDIGKSVSDCKIRWKSLKDVYRKRRREMEEKTNKRQCKWEHLDSLSFLEGIVFTKGNAKKSDATEETNNIDMKIEVHQDELGSDAPSDVPPIKEELLDSYDVTSVKTEQPEGLHPIQLFFDSMARTVMTFPTPLAVKVKRDVLQAVSDAELEMWNGQSRGRFPY